MSPQARRHPTQVLVERRGPLFFGAIVQVHDTGPILAIVTERRKERRTVRCDHDLRRVFVNESHDERGESLLEVRVKVKIGFVDEEDSLGLVV